MKRLLIASLAVMVSCAGPADEVPTTVGNPFLPMWEHIPDGEPYVFEDPDNPGEYRVYIYGSHDSRITDYCGRELVGKGERCFFFFLFTKKMIYVKILG